MWSDLPKNCPVKQNQKQYNIKHAKIRQTELGLVQSPFTTSGQEMERVYSYNLGTRTGHRLEQLQLLIRVQGTCWSRGCCRHSPVNTNCSSESRSATYVSLPSSSARTCLPLTSSENWNMNLEIQPPFSRCVNYYYYYYLLLLKMNMIKVALLHQCCRTTVQCHKITKPNAARGQSSLQYVDNGILGLTSHSTQWSFHSVTVVISETGSMQTSDQQSVRRK